MKKLLLEFRRINWKIPLLVAAICILLFIVVTAIEDDIFLSSYGWDYFAYWSTGRIADERGYSKIYDLDILRTVQMEKLESLGVLSTLDTSCIRVIPAAYFSFFILPFQIFSRIDLIAGYWLWTTLNIAILIGYLIFFIRRIFPERDLAANDLKMLIPIIISYPVFMNIFNGQVNILLLVCAGEFIRNAVMKKPILSGIWLGGLLVKPPSLIFIIPVIFILRNWRILWGFIVSSGIILVTSTLLCGFTGIKSMFNLWIASSARVSTCNIESMINWRMVGLNLNHLLNTSIGWIITGLGMVLTLSALYFLVKNKPSLGSSEWVMMMLGVFSATLAFTWHAHQHMSMVLIPLMIYASINKFLPKNLFLSWAILSLAICLTMTIINATANNSVMVVAFSGFLLNLVVFYSTIRFVKQRN